MNFICLRCGQKSSAERWCRDPAASCSLAPCIDCGGTMARVVCDFCLHDYSELPGKWVYHDFDAETWICNPCRRLKNELTSLKK